VVDASFHTAAGTNLTTTNALEFVGPTSTVHLDPDESAEVIAYQEVTALPAAGTTATGLTVAVCTQSTVTGSIINDLATYKPHLTAGNVPVTMPMTLDGPASVKVGMCAAVAPGHADEWAFTGAGTVHVVVFKKQ
jgi:hypothetical protein